MILRFKTLSTTGTGKIIEDTRRFVQESFSSEEVGLVIGGRAMLLHLLVDIIVHGQVYSILLSISGVLIITTLMFRSLSIGVLNILPITVATIWNFGFMSLVGLPLEPASAITSCIGIGVGIDYSIHFISKYRYLSRQAAMSGLSDDERSIDREAITIRTMETAGKAIFFNALVVIFGFLVLLFSNFPPTRSMGYLISLNMFTCFLGALTLLPAAINLIRLKTIQV
jgi:hypothetical protein